MNQLDDSRIGTTLGQSYAPFEPKVVYSFLSALPQTNTCLPHAAGAALADASRPASDARTIDIVAPVPKARAAPAEMPPLSEYQWSGRGERLPFKRILDVSVSCLLLLVVAPLFLTIGLYLRVREGGPALARQQRIGRLGRPFDLLTFRCGRETGSSAPFGRFLRRSGIEELPKLLNVLRGDLALVGPEPIPESELSKHGLDVIYYLRGRPGLTGTRHLPGRSGESPGSQDREYARTRSFSSDLHVLIASLPDVLPGRRAA